jgi:hypothetical protein
MIEDLDIYGLKALAHAPIKIATKYSRNVFHESKQNLNIQRISAADKYLHK